MKKTFFLIICTLFILINVSDAISGGRVYVKGYYRKDGTYVSPHYRTAPDGNPYNNYSFPGNYNPNTGKTTPGNPDTYLERYYNRGSKSYVPYISPQNNRSITSESATSTHDLPSFNSIPLDQNTSKENHFQRLFGGKNTMPIKQKRASSLNDLFK